MESILGFSTLLNQLLQAAGGWLVTASEIVTMLGNQEFFLLILPILYWAVNPEIGLRVGLILMLSSAVNTILKISFHLPRPYWIDPRVIPYIAETSFGAPSGHAQHAVAVWGMMAVGMARRSFWLVALLLMFIIGASRVVLGVHFPIDVLTGWIIGAILLFLVLSFERPVRQWLSTLEVGAQILVVLGFSLTLLLVGAAITLITLQNFVLPAAWSEQALTAFPGVQPAPFQIDGLLNAAAGIFGFAAGAIILQKFGGFDVSGTLIQKLLRYLLGTLGVLLIWYGLGLILPRSEDLIGYLMRFFRYTLLGLWISWWAPALFIRLKLANPTYASV